MAILARIKSALRGFSGSTSTALVPRQPSAIARIASGLNAAQERIGLGGRRLVSGVQKSTAVQTLRSASDYVMPRGRKLVEAGKGVARYLKAAHARLEKSKTDRGIKKLASAAEKAIKSGDLKKAMEATKQLQVHRLMNRAAEATKNGDVRSALRHLQLAERVQKTGKMPGKKKPPKEAQPEAKPPTPTQHEQSGVQVHVHPPAPKPQESSGGSVQTGKRGGRYVERGGRKRYVGRHGAKP